MNVDKPYISQRSIIAYSALPGVLSAGEWYAAALRKPFTVSCRTSATLTITAGANISPKIRAIVDGASIAIECLFDTTESPSTEYGVSGSGTLTLEVVTAGDETQFLEGTTEIFTVDVLVLGYDLPHGLPTFAAFRRDERVEFSLGAEKYANGNWLLRAVGADGAGLAYGQRICAYVNGELFDSGLLLSDVNDELLIEGTALRPGVYRVYYNLESTTQGIGTGSQLYHPFKGGKGNNSLILWIYEDYQPGDLVVLFKNPAFGADGEPRYLAAPFAPAKLGDVGLPIEIPGDPPVTVMHSLHNRFAALGSLALLMDDLAGATWKRYPLRRLLSLFSVGATVTMHFGVRETTKSYSETHNPGGESPEGDNSGNYPDGVPSVAQIDDAGGAITVSTFVNWIKEDTDITASASADITFTLSHALWSADFPKYLEAVLNRAETYSNRQSSYSRDRRASEKSSSHTRTYRVESITEAEAIARGIPFPGDGQGAALPWSVASGTARYHFHGEGMAFGGATVDEYVDFAYVPATGEWTATPSGVGVFTNFEPSVSIDTTTGALTVTMSEGPSGRSVTGTGTPAVGALTVSASAGNTWNYEADEGESVWSETVSISATGQTAGRQDSPGATGPHAGVPDPNNPGYVRVVFLYNETMSGYESATVGGASTTTGSDFGGHGTTTLVFGEGRDPSWPHRAVCAAAGGEGGISVDFTVANAQRRVTENVTHGGRRTRTGGSAAWTYVSGSAATWGTTTTVTTVDETQPETVGGPLGHGETFQTGILALLLGTFAMGTLTYNHNSTVGSGSGSAFGYRPNPQTGETDSADVDPVSGTWSEESITTTGAPPRNESRGEELTVGDLDLSGEIDGAEWEQWGYSYDRHEIKTTCGITIAVTDAEYAETEQYVDRN